MLDINGYCEGADQLLRIKMTRIRKKRKSLSLKRRRKRRENFNTRSQLLGKARNISERDSLDKEFDVSWTTLRKTEPSGASTLTRSKNLIE